MADIEKGKKAEDALEAEKEGGAGEQRKAQPTVSDLMKNAAAALGDFDDEVPAAAVEAAPVVENESVAVESETESEPVEVAMEASTAETVSVESEIEAQALMDTMPAAEPEAPAEAEVEAKPAKKGRGKGKASKAKSGKGKKKKAEVEWNAETRDLDFRPDASEEPTESSESAAESAEPVLEAMMSEGLEGELSEMVSEELEIVPETPIEESEEAMEASANDAILAEMAGELASEEPTPEVAQSAMEEELDEAENDADPEPVEFIEHDQLVSIIESLLFSTDKPVSIATIKQIFKGTNIRTKDINRALDLLASEYAAPTRGVSLEEINGGYQLRTKVDNAEYLRRLAKTRPFRLSGPALEVMAIVAYKQPITKHEIDEIRGVESGHLLRALMERNLVAFGGKAENLPGKPMTYNSTRKFLEIFGLRNLKELPTLSEIDELLPEGIGEVEEKETLSELTDRLSTELTSSYSEGEEELTKINEQLLQIDTTSEFFEQEKQRERDRRDRERAQDIREKLVLGDEVDEKDRRWLDRYEAKLQAIEAAAQAGETITVSAEEMDAAPDIGDQLQALTEESTQTPAQASGEQEEDLSDVDPALFEESEGDDLAANVDWDEDGGSDHD